MKPRIILLVEDNPDDQALTLRAVKPNNIMNEVVVVEDGAEALDATPTSPRNRTGARGASSPLSLLLMEPFSGREGEQSADSVGPAPLTPAL